MTRQTFLTRVRQMSDTLHNAVDYPDELLKDFASMVHLDEWRKLLNEAPYYQTATRSVALDANRQFAWSALSSGSGNARESVYRVLEMTDADGRTILYQQPDRVTLAQGASAETTQRLWTRNGANVQTFGTQPNTTITVLVNWTPTPIGALASDSDSFAWVEHWEPVLYYECAAFALSKGGRETGEANELLRMADNLRQRLLADIRRESATPYILGADDQPWEWGG